MALRNYLLRGAGFVEIVTERGDQVFFVQKHDSCDPHNFDPSSGDTVPDCGLRQRPPFGNLGPVMRSLISMVMASSPFLE